MKPLYRNIFSLAILQITILVTGLILTSDFDLEFNFRDITILSFSFTFLSLITILIFFRGQKKDSESQTIHLLFALGIKFIMELVIALLWFFVAKKTSLALVLLFFILYLTFTLFSVLVVLKTLKYKPL